MANLWLDLKGPILADTVYINGVLVAKDVTITLPAVTHVTADYKAMGTYTAPMTGQIEGMEAAITKIGIDKGLRSSRARRWRSDGRRMSSTPTAPPRPKAARRSCAASRS